jgi:dTDP-glucose 4,6-dehydratase
MRVVITGGAGFLGSHLSQKYVEAGHEVVCLDNLLTGEPSNIEHLLGHDGFTFVKTDVSEYIHVSGPVDQVLHFASPASPVDYLKLPIHTMKVGSLGTLHGLGLAKEKRARFVLASTSEAYGDPLVHPQPENYWGNVNPVGPRGVYDEAKRFAEALTMAYRRTHDMDTGIIRIFNTFGPRMRLHDGRAIPTFIAQALEGEDLTVHGNGLQTRSICYVDDLIEGIYRFAQSTSMGPMNLGNPHEITMKVLAEAIIKMTKSSSDIVYVPRPVDDPEVRRPDITLARTVLGWEPQVSVPDGLQRTIDWFSQ